MVEDELLNCGCVHVGGGVLGVYPSRVEGPTMSSQEFGPYRATALWNEAVTMFRDGVPKGERRHRFHKHKNSFTGSEAVTFLHGALRSSNLFNPDVSREQAKQLLNQFMVADLIRVPRECSVAVPTGFRDSTKYVYEFTETLASFKSHLPLTAMNDRLRLIRDKRENALANGTDSTRPSNDSLWKAIIIRRIKEFMDPLDASLLIPHEKIKDEWVLTNVSPEWKKLRWNTELPYWVLDAIRQLMKCFNSKDDPGRFPAFEEEIFNVIIDYFGTLENPLIPPYLNNLVFNVFIYLESLNSMGCKEVCNREFMTVSQENLLNTISSPRKIHKPVRSKGTLPPDSCYETAFTSDNPTMRIVPQSAIDIVHLKKDSRTHSYQAQSLCHGRDIHENVINVKKQMALRKPLKSTENMRYVADRPNFTHGVDNQGFIATSPASVAPKERYSYYPGKSERYPGRYLSKSVEDLDHVHVYINHGLNSSLDESFSDDSQLDYKYAIETINRMVVATKSNSSCCSDDTSTYYTASTGSPDVNDPEQSTKSKNTTDESHLKWRSAIMKMGVSAFQFIFLLLPPSNRAQMRHLMSIMFHVCFHSKLDSASISETMLKFRHCVMRPSRGETVAQNLLTRILNFIAFQYEDIFAEVSDDVLSSILAEVSTEAKNRTNFCLKVSGKTFEQQKVTESQRALIDLFDQILADTNLPYKTKKRHLKTFKECYPEIYHEKIVKSKSTKPLHLFRM